jgi:LPS sulfotransferase NodH
VTGEDVTEAPPSDGPSPVVPVHRSYLVCAVPRSGSYLLCEGLRATGVAGRPTEYFSSGFRAYWAPQWGTPDFPAYLRRVVRTGTTPNGVFGGKTHAGQFDYFARQASGRMPVPHADRPALLARWFPDLRYVRLRRRDPVRQAVSYMKAIQTNEWWDADQAPAPFDAPRSGAERYDHLLIEASIERLAEEDRRWDRYFATIDVEPLTLYYEDLSRDRDAAVRTVLDYLGLAAPPDRRPPPPSFRRQADERTERWVARFHEIRGVGVPPPPAPATGEPGRFLQWYGEPEPMTISGPPHRPPPVAIAPREPPDPHGTLRPKLAATRWWRSTEPFAHARAWPVFREDVYDEMVEAYRGFQEAGRLRRGIPGYDVTAVTLTPEMAGPFSVFLTRAWHDVLASLFDVDATGDVNVSIHHHAVGSTSGSPHNDLNPGWFAVDGDPLGTGVTVSDPEVCEYRSGRTPDGRPSVERVRAVACIFHFGNSDGTPVGGSTGFYRSPTDPVERPLVDVPPRNNSLVAFECTPFSYHAFVSNRTHERNSLVMWIHRSKEDAVARFGEASIVGW